MKRHFMNNERGKLAFLDANVPRISTKAIVGKGIESASGQENVTKRRKVENSLSCYVSPSKKTSQCSLLREVPSPECQFSLEQWYGSKLDLENIIRTEQELQSRLNLHEDFCKDSRHGIESEHREICVDWIIDMQYYLKAENETAHLAVNLFDNFVNKEKVESEQLHMVAAACMWLAHKFYHGGLKAKSILRYCQGGSLAELRSMERRVLQAADMNVIFTNPITLLNFQWFKICGLRIPRVEYQASNYFFELMVGSIHFVHVCPNMKAYLAVHASVHLFKLASVSKYKLESPKLAEHYGQLLNSLRQIRDSPGFRGMSAIYKKYSSSRYGKVAKHHFMDPDRT